MRRVRAGVHTFQKLPQSGNDPDSVLVLRREESTEEIVLLLSLQTFPRKLVVLRVNGPHRAAFPLFGVLGFRFSVLREALQIALETLEVLPCGTEALEPADVADRRPPARHPAGGTQVPDGPFHFRDGGIEGIGEGWLSTHCATPLSPRSGLFPLDLTENPQKRMMRTTSRLLDQPVRGSDVLVRVRTPM